MRVHLYEAESMENELQSCVSQSVDFIFSSIIKPVGCPRNHAEYKSAAQDGLTLDRICLLD